MNFSIRSATEGRNYFCRSINKNEEDGQFCRRAGEVFPPGNKAVDAAVFLCEGAQVVFDLPYPWLPIDPNPESPFMAKKVLIVEDEKLIGLMLAENVRELGCQVSQVVTNGRAAVHAVKNERPDAILMDISLAGSMDGIETAQAIKSIQDIPILFFTGYQDQQLLDRASSVKPFGIVDKLDTSEAILAAIDSLLQ